MAKLPFSVFRRAGRRFYYVAFKNENTGEYLPAISTKQETESGAVKTALQWLKDGVPRRSEIIPLKKYSLRDMAREAEISPQTVLKGRENFSKADILSESKYFKLT